MPEGCLAAFGMNCVIDPYFVLQENVFLNTQNENGNFFDKAASALFSPIHYLLVGKSYYIDKNDNENPVKIHQIYDYNEGNISRILLIAIAILLTPVSLVVGVILKGISLLSSKARADFALIYHHMHNASNISPTDYEAFGIQSELYSEEFARAPDTFLPRPETDLADIQHKMQAELKFLSVAMGTLKEKGIPCWLDCGTALGAYRHGGMIPWDKDIDIAILQKDFLNFKNALRDKFGDRIVLQDWSPAFFPKTAYKIFFKDTNNLIDVYTYDIIDPIEMVTNEAEKPVKKPKLKLVINGEEQEVNDIDQDHLWDEELSKGQNVRYRFSDQTWMPEAWKVRERECQRPKPLTALFPLKKCYFDGIDEDGKLTQVELAVPNNLEQWLQSNYGVLEPSKVWDEQKNKYVAVENHPYWIHHDPQGMLE